MAAVTQGSRDTFPGDPSSFIFSPSSSASSEARFLPNRQVVPQHPCAKLLVAMLTVLELSAAVPTLWLEQQFGQAIEHFVLRLSLMLLRLYPILRVLAICLYYCGPSSCIGMLPFPLQWRCRRWLQREYCSKLPEIRWGMVVTLDLWFFGTTQLVAGAGGDGGPLAVASVALLVANSLLCTLDVLALLTLLLSRQNDQNLAEIYPEVTFHRPQSIKWTVRNGTDSTCAICLSEFREGESAQLLPCSHTFHTDCIASWLQVSRHCPMRCPEFVLPPRPDLSTEPGQLHESGEAESMVTQYHGELSRHSTAEVDVIPELLVLPGQVPRGTSS